MRSAIQIRALSKHFGAIDAVVDCSFDVHYGSVTGLLGPNGAGKSTTFRMILGLVRPSSGEALIDGVPFAQHANPGSTVGAVFEMTGFYPGCDGRGHLRIAADAIGVDMVRVNEVLDLVGLSSVARRPVHKMSLGMRQRLQLAVALLGDPKILMLDEPTNGLDPEGISWFRSFVHDAAREGKAVLIASHLLAEMAQTIDHVVVIANGSVKANCSLKEFVAPGESRVEVSTDQPQELQALLVSRGAVVIASSEASGTLDVKGLSAREVGSAAATAGIAVSGLREEAATLEEMYLDLTGTTSIRGNGDSGGGSVRDRRRSARS